MFDEMNKFFNSSVDGYIKDTKKDMKKMLLDDHITYVNNTFNKFKKSIEQPLPLDQEKYLFNPIVLNIIFKENAHQNRKWTRT